MYDSYAKYIYEFLQQHWADISSMLSSVEHLAISLNIVSGLVRMILEAVIFFGLLNFGFKFIRARWLTIC